MAWQYLAGAAISAAANYFGSQSASDAQVGGSKRAIEEQRRQFDYNAALQRPYYETGTQALSALGRLYGLGGGSAYPGGQAQGGLPVTPIVVGKKRGQSGGMLDINGIGNVNPFSYGKVKRVGGLIDPIAGTVDSSANDKRDAQFTEYLRTGQGAPSGGHGKFSKVKSAIDDLRAQGWTYQSPAKQSVPSTEADPGAPGWQDLSGFFASPDYQFRFDEGMRGADQSAAARGGLLSGNQLRDVTQLAGNFASNEYGNYFNRLAAIAGIGQTATNNLTVLGQNSANNISGLQQNIGDSRASGVLGIYNGTSNAINSGIQNYMLDRAGYFNNPYQQGGYSPGYGAISPTPELPQIDYSLGNYYSSRGGF